MIPAKEIINKGAEAVIFKYKNIIVKNRIEKTYRHPIIDQKLRKFRTNREIKIMKKLSELNILTPKLILNNQDVNNFMLSNEINPKYSIAMDFINGIQLKNLVNENNYPKYGQLIGETIAKIHNNNIVHGDLTTSNMMMEFDDFFLIDFGLSSFSSKIEDKAVDLHLLKESINSKHSAFAREFFDNILVNYQQNIKNYDDIMTRFRVVEKRGKNKNQ